MQGRGFGGGPVLLGRQGPEKEVGMVATCLTRDFSDFVDSRPTPLKMPRGDGAHDLLAGPLRADVDCSRCCKFFLRLSSKLPPKQPSVILVLFPEVTSI